MTLQRMFMFVGYSEQAGSGYPKILSGWRGEHWAEPFISDDYDDCQTFLTLKLNDIPATEHHIVPYDVPETAESTVVNAGGTDGTTQKNPQKNPQKNDRGARIADEGINEGINEGIKPKDEGISESVYRVIASKNGISAPDVARIIGKSLATIERAVANLVAAGRVEHRGSKKTGGYFAKGAAR